MNLPRPFRLLAETLAPHRTLFFSGLALKLLLGCLLASGYMVHLFAPFVNYTVGENPTQAYNWFNTHGGGNEFPYPPLMLALLAIPRFLLGIFSPASYTSVSFIDIAALRLTLLVADTVILFILLRWLKRHGRRVMWLYWFSPVLIYINYIHGQLDVIPVCFLLLSLYQLFRKKIIAAGIFLGLAICCKTSILLAVPFIFIYAYKHPAIPAKTWLRAALYMLLAIVAINLPFIGQSGFRQMVYNNAEQAKLFATVIPLSAGGFFLVIPAVYLLLVIKFRLFWQINRDLLLMFLGFAFGIITIFITPMQGWYYWSLPFFIYFLVKENNYARLLYWLITAGYFLYFLLTPVSDYKEIFQLLGNRVPEKGFGYNWLNENGVNAQTILNLALTLLQTAMIGFCWVIYRYGITQLQQHKLLYQPCMVGISGDSASGKTTVAELLSTVFGASETALVSGDDMHRWQRGHVRWQQFTHLNPKANLLHLNLLHHLRLQKGKPVKREKYDHDSGRFTPEETIPFNRIIIFEGLHSFFLEYQRELFDLKIFMEPDEDLRKKWKLERDAGERGHTMDDVLKAIEKRIPDAGKYIAPQRQQADVIVRMEQKENGRLQLRFSCLNHIYMDELVEALENEPGLILQHNYEEARQEILCDGEITVEAVARVGAPLQEMLEEMGFPGAEWQGGYNGLLQLFLLQALFYKMELHAATHSEVFFN